MKEPTTGPLRRRHRAIHYCYASGSQACSSQGDKVVQSSKWSLIRTAENCFQGRRKKAAPKSIKMRIETYRYFMF